MRRAMFRVQVLAAAAAPLVLSWTLPACRRETRAPASEEDAAPGGTSPAPTPSTAPSGAPPASEDVVVVPPPETASADAAESRPEVSAPDTAGLPERPVVVGSPPVLPRSPSLRPLAPATGRRNHSLPHPSASHRDEPQDVAGQGEEARGAQRLVQATRGEGVQTSMLLGVGVPAEQYRGFLRALRSLLLDPDVGPVLPLL